MGPRRLGPFKVIERIGDLDYRLELPDWMRIHNVIHVDRLSPYHENGLPSPNALNLSLLMEKRNGRLKKFFKVDTSAVVYTIW